MHEAWNTQAQCWCNLIEMKIIRFMGLTEEELKEYVSGVDLEQILAVFEEKHKKSLKRIDSLDEASYRSYEKRKHLKLVRAKGTTI